MHTDNKHVLRRIATAIIAIATIGATSGCLEKEADTPENPTASADMKKLKTWTRADWLHDIDEAYRVMKAAEDGKYGSPSTELVMLLDNPRVAIKMAEVGTVDECWPNPGMNSIISTALTNHACLDAKGHKRSK